jgi:WD40 repeat protein
VSATALALTWDGRLAAVGGSDGSLRIWDLDSGDCVRRLISEPSLDEREDAQFTTLAAEIKGVGMTGDGRLLASYGADKTLRIWSVATGECLREFVGLGREAGTSPGHFDEPAESRVALSSDGRLVYHRDTLWRVASGECLRQVQFTHSRGEVADVALTPDLRMAVSASGGSHMWSGERHWYMPNVLHVWELASGGSVRTFKKISTSPSQAHGGLRRVAVTWDGALSVSVGRDLRVWDLVSGVEERELPGEGLGDIALSPDGRTIVSSADNSLLITDTISGRQSSLRSHDDAITSLAVSGDGGTALSASCDGTVGMWDLDSRLCLRTLKGHKGYVYSVVFASDGRVAVSGGDGALIIVWDLVVGRPMKQIGGRAGVMSCIVALTPDNRFVLTSAADSCELHLWDLLSGTRVRTFEGHQDLVTDLVLTPDGRTGVSASNDGSLRTWDLRSGECLRVLKGHSARVAGVRLTPDGGTVISASDDRTIRVWSLVSGECIACYVAYSEVCAVSEVATDGRFYCLTYDHQRHCLRLENLGQEPPVVTAVRMFRFQSVRPEWIAALAVTRGLPDASTQTVAEGQPAFPEGPIPGRYDSDITAGCAWCGERFAPSSEVIQVAQLNASCLDLPSDAWDHASLISECPHCRKPVLFNPIIVDRGCYGADGTDRSLLPRVGYLSRPDLRTLEGHSDEIKAVKLTGDGRRLLSASVDSTLRVWDVETGECLHTLEGHSGAVWAVDVSRDGKLAASGGRDGALRVWDIERGECPNVHEGHGECVSSVALSPDGSRAVSSSWDGTVRVWDVANGRCLHILQGDAGQVYAVALSAEKRIIVSGGEDGIIRVWDLESGECLQEIENDDQMIIAIDLAKEGRIAALRCMDPAAIITVQVWDLAEPRRVNSFDSDNLGPNSVRMTEDGRGLVVADGFSIQVWDLERTELRQRFVEDAGPPNHKVVTATPDARRIASGGDDHKVRVWQVGVSEPLQLLKDDSHFANVACLVGNGGRAITGGLDGSLRVWSLETGDCLATHEAHPAAVYTLAATADGSLAVSGSLDGSLAIWDLERGTRLHDLRGHEKSITAVALTVDGRRAVSASWDGTVRVWDVGSGWCVGTFEGHESPVDALALTPDGRWAVSAGQFEYGGEVRVWDLESGECRQVIRSEASAIAVTPDRRLAITGHPNGNLEVWDLAEGQGLGKAGDHRGALYALAVTSDGQRIVSAGWDHIVKVWDGGECLVECPIPEGLQVLVLRDDLLAARDAAGAVLVYGTVDPTNRPPPLVTPVRIFDYDRRTWDGEVTALCEYCGKRFVVPQAMIDTIGEIGHGANLSEAESPCLKLPAEAWQDQRLRSRCLHCRRPLTISPFVVDNRDRH